MAPAFVASRPCERVLWYSWCSLPVEDCFGDQYETLPPLTSPCDFLTMPFTEHADLCPSVGGTGQTALEAISMGGTLARACRTRG